MRVQSIHATQHLCDGHQLVLTLFLTLVLGLRDAFPPDELCVNESLACVPGVLQLLDVPRAFEITQRVRRLESVWL